MAANIVAQMQILISAQTKGLNAALSQSQSALQKLQSSITQTAGAIGIAFGAQQLAAFTLEITKLAGEAEGVRAAFERLPASAALMEDLKEATGGTVSELELMKRTVQATNFGISLEALPKLLEFAAVRAQQTGQSIDYLVDSIVTGIGRKSPLILDNLGISTTRLKEQFGGAALEAQSIGDVANAVGRIAEEELSKMGGLAETSATKMAALSASWENFKVVLGGLTSGALGSAIDQMTKLAEVTGIFFGGKASNQTAVLENQIKLLNESGIEGEGYAEALKVVEKTAESLGVKLIKLTDGASGVTKVLVDTRTAIQSAAGAATQDQITTLDSLQAKIKELNTQFEETNATDQAKLQNIGQQIIATNAQIEALEKLRKKQEEVGTLQTQFAKDQLKNASLKVKTEVDADLTTSTLGGGFLTQIPAPKIGPAMDALFTYTEAVKAAGVAGIQSTEQQILANQLLVESEQRKAEMAQAVGQIIGDAAGDVITGQKTVLQALAGITQRLLPIFLSQALAGTIAGAGKTAAPPPAIIAMAVAGVAAISSLFAKATGHSRSVGGAGAAAGARATTNVAKLQPVPSQTESIQFDAKFRLEGKDLVASVNSTNNAGGRLSG